MTLINQYYYEILSLGFVSSLIAVCYLLYFRVSAGNAYVRTGWGKPKVVVDKGAFVLPFLHTVTPIDLQTYTVDLVLGGKQSLMTQDYVRMDVNLALTVRIASQPDSILIAMRALGGAALRESKLRAVLEAESTAVMRATAATMNLEALHHRRYEFSDAVTKRLGLQLQQYGLDLVSVSLVDLEQTDKVFYDTAHVLDAKGLAALDRCQAGSSTNHHQPPQLVLISEQALATERRIVPLQLAKG